MNAKAKASTIPRALVQRHLADTWVTTEEAAIRLRMYVRNSHVFVRLGKTIVENRRRDSTETPEDDEALTLIGIAYRAGRTLSSLCRDGVAESRSRVIDGVAMIHATNGRPVVEYRVRPIHQQVRSDAMGPSVEAIAEIVAAAGATGLSPAQTAAALGHLVDKKRAVKSYLGRHPNANKQAKATGMTRAAVEAAAVIYYFNRQMHHLTVRRGQPRFEKQVQVVYRVKR